ncbi:uncharacterized protein LOC126782648 [Argentina anserina]|uniref:uncharacterized protein LOC126782648 n=1 Tax=Argentina anserina TaxID=57926 RepID=UPI00217659DB|nr:uncharacterized protein LOC126782648 [Potentilla anserina]
MTPNQSYSRINTSELKDLIIQKIGKQRAERYFDMIRRLFSYKINKCEFDRFCNQTIGRENIHLHNRLIKSILKNACLAKAPPLRGVRKAGSTLNAKVENGYPGSCLQSIYGDGFPKSPRKVRSPLNRDHRKFRDRPIPLVPNGKPQNFASEEPLPKVQEQHELLSLGSRPPVEVASVEDGEEVEQDAGSPGIQSRSPVTAPLGISMKLGGSRKSLHTVSVGGAYRPETCQNCGELPDTRSLRARLQHKLEMEGMTVSTDCLNLFNNGLDAYLKRLIEPCIRLAGSRHEKDHFNQQNSLYIHGSNGMTGRPEMQRELSYATMVDFRAAMELNPQILGEDWATQLEKIFLPASEE